MMDSWADAGAWPPTSLDFTYFQAIYQAVIERIGIDTGVKDNLASNRTPEAIMKDINSVKDLYDALYALRDSEKFFNHIVYFDNDNGIPDENGSAFANWAISEAEAGGVQKQYYNHHKTLNTSDEEIFRMIEDARAMIDEYQWIQIPWADTTIPPEDGQPSMKYQILGKNGVGNGSQSTLGTSPPGVPPATDYQSKFAFSYWITSAPLRASYEDVDPPPPAGWTPDVFLPGYIDTADPTADFTRVGKSYYDDALTASGGLKGDIGGFSNGGRLVTNQGAIWGYYSQIWQTGFAWSYPVEIRMYPPFADNDGLRNFTTFDCKIYFTRFREYEEWIDDTHNDSYSNTQDDGLKTLVHNSTGNSVNDILSVDVESLVKAYWPYANETAFINSVGFPAGFLWGDFGNLPPDYKQYYQRIIDQIIDIVVLVKPNYGFKAD